MTDMRKLAERLVAELVASGARAVVLTGSYARGDATALSDLDLVVVGDGPEYRLEARDGVLVSQSWASEEAHRERFDSPGEVGSSVPGWREAIVLHDPDGVAAGLQNEARCWTWERLGDRIDAWAAEQLVGLAEEVQKLAAALAAQRTLTAAAQRNILALQLAPILAVHLRSLYGSENVLWDQVGERMGAEWREAQAAAFGTSGENLEESCAAGLRLYRLATDRVAPVLNERQAAVVRGAYACAGCDFFSA